MVHRLKTMPYIGFALGLRGMNVKAVNHHQVVVVLVVLQQYVVHVARACASISARVRSKGRLTAPIASCYGRGWIVNDNEEWSRRARDLSTSQASTHR